MNGRLYRVLIHMLPPSFVLNALFIFPCCERKRLVGTFSEMDDKHAEHSACNKELSPGKLSKKTPERNAPEGGTVADHSANILALMQGHRGIWPDSR